MPLLTAVTDDHPPHTAATPAPASPPLPPAESALLWAPLLELVPALRVLIGLGIAALVIAALHLGRDLLIPLALAGLLGFLLDPAVCRLKRWGLPRALAVALVGLAALGSLVAAGAYLTVQLRAVSTDLPTYQDTIRGKIGQLHQQLRGPSAWDGAVSTLDTVQDQIQQVTEDTPRPTQRVEVVQPPPGPIVTASQWLARIGGPLATAAIVALFVILILLDRDSLRDRMLRLMGGGNLHRATDALDEATTRISRYLRMQLIINASYGVPMAVGLWFIGVPGAVLWGALATVMRFVPYVGPLVSALFPLTLAFAVSPGWEMVLWTLALIAVLELLSNYLLEPWLYGASTGLSTLSVIVAAIFWTALWGPIGLILSTPLTVCLLVLGRHVPGLGFIEGLLGTTPVLALPQRLYQRLLAGDVEEATDMASQYIDAAIGAEHTDAARVAAAVTAFYDQVGLPILQLASQQHAGTATAQHRLRLAQGMGALLEELEEQYPAPEARQHPSSVHCVGVRWEVDGFAAAMAAHALRLAGWPARAHALASPMTWRAAEDLAAADIVCLSVFHPQPPAQLRHLARRLRRRHPALRVVAAPWLAAASSVEQWQLGRSGLDGVAQDLGALLLQVASLADAAAPAGTASGQRQEAARVSALHDEGWLDPALHALFHASARKAANAFDTRYAQVSLIDADTVRAPGSLLPTLADGTALPRQDSLCTHVALADGPLVINDLSADPRAQGLHLVNRYQLRFYAGMPLRSVHGEVVGCLCLMDNAPRSLSAQELALLAELAAEVEQGVHGAD